MNELISILEREGLLASDSQLKEAQNVHGLKMSPLRSPMEDPEMMMTLMERGGVSFEDHHLQELVDGLSVLLNWNLDRMDLPEIEDFTMEIEDSEENARHRYETHINHLAVRMEAFVHGGSFLLAERLLGNLGEKSNFWKEAEQFFHLHLFLHLGMFHTFGFQPPHGKVMAGQSRVEGEVLPSGKTLIRSKASGSSPEVLVMELCKALCFRWASPIYRDIKPLPITSGEEFPFFVHAPIRVKENWGALIDMINLRVPLSTNSSDDEQLFLKTSGLSGSHQELHLQDYFLGELKAFICKKSLPMEAESRRLSLAKYKAR